MWCKLQVHSGSRSPFACTSWLGWFQESSSICSTDRTILISIARKTRSACLWLPRLLTFELEVREAHYSSDRFRLNSRTWPFSDWAIFQRLTQNIGRASKASARMQSTTLTVGRIFFLPAQYRLFCRGCFQPYNRPYLMQPLRSDQGIAIVQSVLAGTFGVSSYFELTSLSHCSCALVHDSVLSLLRQSSPFRESSN